MRRVYSREFKEAIVAKILNRGGKSIREVCEDENVGLSAAANWIRGANMPPMVKKTGSRKWTSKEKLRVFSESLLASSEEEVGLLLRKEGLHSHQLNEWRAQILASLEPPTKRAVAKDERDDQIKKLEREILRKDKALAEASALLILKKKVNLIWGNEEEK